MKDLVDDALSLFWSGARRIGPSDKHDVFYTRFAVTILTVTQLLILIWLVQFAFADAFRQVSNGLIEFLLLTLGAVLAIINSFAIFRIDGKRSSLYIPLGRRVPAIIFISLYFVLAAFCAARILG